MLAPSWFPPRLTALKRLWAEDGSRDPRLGRSTPPQNVSFGYLVGSFLMMLGGLTELVFGVDSERRSLEQVAAPLTALQVEHAAAPV